tara:strand:- start:1023 stop:1223 length:201 start_codon:yes stop_codon:yes gene_type:complete
MMKDSMLDVQTTKNKELGLWEITATLTLPPITISRYKKDKSDIEYELRNAFSEVVQEVVEKHCEDT